MVAAAGPVAAGRIPANRPNGGDAPLPAQHVGGHGLDRPAKVLGAGLSKAVGQEVADPLAEVRVGEGQGVAGIVAGPELHQPCPAFADYDIVISEVKVPGDIQVAGISS